MPRYSEERKAAILKKLLPPHNRSVTSVATEEGISNATLYSWLKQCREKGVPVPGYTQGDYEWSPDAKLAVVIETATMSETELGAYCREKGLYPEQIQQWKAACLEGAGRQEEQAKAAQKQRKEDRKTIKQLKAEVRRKDKVLAETTSLLAFKKARSLVRRGSGQRRGRLTPLKERARLIALFDEAVVGGASRYQAAAVIGISERTLKRWRSERGAIVEDQRPHAGQRRQPHQLTHEEEQAILNTCHRSEYQSLPPSQIVPLLADEGVYLASESSFYRVLKKHHQQHHRGRMKPRRSVPEPTSFTATGPNQVTSVIVPPLCEVSTGIFT